MISFSFPGLNQFFNSTKFFAAKQAQFSEYFSPMKMTKKFVY